MFEKTKIPLTIYDIRWLSAHSNQSEHTIKAYQIFVDTYLHEYSKPGKYQTVANLDSDSRLFVILGQQFDSKRDDLKLDDLLADTLILYALEGTDPDKKNLKSENQIKDSIKKYLKFDPQLLDNKISERLIALTTKPRKIKYHTKEQGYCLPYETRVEIGEGNLKDEVLYNDFYSQTQETIKSIFLMLKLK